MKKSVKSTDKRLKLTPIAAAVMAVSYSISTVAEESAAIEEIIVTATKRESSMQDVGQSITAFSGDDIEQMGIRSIEEYVRAMPSIAMQATNPGRNQIVMRGVSTGSNEYRTDSQAAVYLDEQPMTTNSQQVGVRAIDMERIEVLPGPQGTLFGSSSQTGTMRLITNKPNFDGVAGFVDASYGSTQGGDASHEVSGMLNVPIIDDVLSVRAVMYTLDEGGYVDNVYGTTLSGNFDNADVVDDDYNEYELDGGRIAALWNINDKWDLLLSYITEDGRSEGSWETDPYLGDHKITRFVDEFREDDWYSAAFTLTGDLGFAELSVTATHFERDIAYVWDNNVYAQQKDRYFGGGLYYELYYANDPNYVNYYNLGLYDAEYISSAIVNDQYQERDTIEIRLTSSSDSKLRWMVGAYYEDVYDEWYYYTHQPDLMSTRAWATANAYAYYYLYLTGSSRVQYPLLPTTVGYSNTFERTVEQIAVFGEMDYDVSDKLTLNFGIRWAEFERDEFDRYQFPEGLSAIGGHTDNGEFGDSGTSSDTIYKIGAQYHIDDQKMIYALFSQGFRLGGVNSQRAANTGAVPRSYDPDYLDNFEVGLKSQWLDNQLQLNASAFHMKWDDYHDSISGVGAWWVRGTVNASTAETTGLEVNATYQPTSRLSISGSLFVANPEFTDDYINPNTGGLEIRDGQAMPGSPEEKAWLSITYDIPDVLGGNMWVYYDISYQSETWNDSANARDLDENGLADSWTYSNLQVGLNLANGWDVTLHINNLFDQETYSWISTYDNDDADLFGDPRYHNVRSIDRPRTTWLQVKKSF